MFSWLWIVMIVVIIISVTSRAKKATTGTTPARPVAAPPPPQGTTARTRLRRPSGPASGFSSPAGLGFTQRSLQDAPGAPVTGGRALGAPVGPESLGVLGASGSAPTAQRQKPRPQQARQAQPGAQPPAGPVSTGAASTARPGSAATAAHQAPAASLFTGSTMGGSLFASGSVLTSRDPGASSHRR